MLYLSQFSKEMANTYASTLLIATSLMDEYVDRDRLVSMPVSLDTGS